jgi:hypothetical protein
MRKAVERRRRGRRLYRTFCRVFEMIRNVLRLSALMNPEHGGFCIAHDLRSHRYAHRRIRFDFNAPRAPRINA